MIPVKLSSRGRIDDPSLEKPIDVAMFRQDDGSYNVAWRRPQRKLTTPVNTGEDTLPPLDAVSGNTGTNGPADTRTMLAAMAWAAARLQRPGESQGSAPPRRRTARRLTNRVPRAGASCSIGPKACCTTPQAGLLFATCSCAAR